MGVVDALWWVFVQCRWCADVCFHVAFATGVCDFFGNVINMGRRKHATSRKPPTASGSSADARGSSWLYPAAMAIAAIAAAAAGYTAFLRDSNEMNDLPPAMMQEPPPRIKVRTTSKSANLQAAAQRALDEAGFSGASVKSVNTEIHRNPPPQSRPAPDPACKDIDSNCPSWAASGECENNPSFMMSQCESSCHACDRV